MDLSAKEGDEAMQKVIECYSALPPRERNAIMPEKLADLAGVTPGELIASVSKSLWEHNQAVATINASIAHPKVVQTTAKAAENVMYGVKDRELFFRVTGGLPDKKGASIVINNNPQTANINAGSAANGYRPMDQRIAEQSKLLAEPTLNVIDVPFMKAAEVVQS